MGDCFEVTMVFVWNETYEKLMRDVGRPVVLSEKGPVRIAHGLPVGTGGLVTGVRHWHAWIEWDLPAVGMTVLDHSNGKEFRLERSDYYRIGQLDEDHVWRFTIKEARRQYRRWQHCGPWVPNYDEVEEAMNRREERRHATAR